PDAGAAPKPVSGSQTATPTPVVNTTTATVKPGDWREGLKSKDAKVRAEAALSIVPGDLATPPPELIAALGDTEPSVRRAAVKGVLGFILQNSDTTAVP